MPQKPQANDGWKQEWAKIRQSRAKLLAEGQVLLLQVQSRYHVVCPYSLDFVARAKAIGGKWRRRSGAWTFPSYALPLLRDLLADIYGAEKIHDTIPAKRAKL